MNRIKAVYSTLLKLYLVLFLTVVMVDLQTFYFLGPVNSLIHWLYTHTKESEFSTVQHLFWLQSYGIYKLPLTVFLGQFDNPAHQTLPPTPKRMRTL